MVKYKERIKHFMSCKLTETNYTFHDTILLNLIFLLLFTIIMIIMIIIFKSVKKKMKLKQMITFAKSEMARKK